MDSLRLGLTASSRPPPRTVTALGAQAACAPIGLA